MADQPAPQALFTLDNTLGAIVVGFAVACVIFGILLTQGWTYFSRYNSDSTLYKLLVVLILLLETTDQSFIGHAVYFYTVTSAGNATAVATGTTTWSIILQQAVGSVVGTIVKCCFATRVYRFSDRNIFITGFIILLSLGQLAVALIFTIQAFQLPSIPAVFRLKTLATISLGLGSFTDVVTAASLSFFLWRMRTNHKSAANSLIMRLVMDAVNTGILTTAVSLSTLFLFDFLTGNLIFAATYFMLSKLYAVSFLATLNARRVVHGRGTDHEKDDTSERRGTTARSRTREQEEVETNMFHLGTRMPTLHEHDVDEVYPPYDLKPGFPPEAMRGYQPQFAL
ncbi:hypothetical protein B0H16DRAFT_1530597 [Mycena metata]|uniref:DUF6534 domain-containing protein n=1 Tax=Mycena metata TaxID=1033252 RepID=A0AAD7JCX4_9AGAR|nr:hypothetical protein B0H16DRAFT_1530597 [Mycena metata]